MMFAGKEHAYTANESHLLTVKAWEQLKPRRSCSLWHNERKTGVTGGFYSQWVDWKINPPRNNA
jgi:hypothetical protein